MAINVAQMDKISGLSAGKMAAMDKVASGGGNAKTNNNQNQQQNNAGKPSGDWTDMLPGIFGTAGQIGGGILGTGAGVAGGAAIPGADLTGVPEVAGGIGGERIGQTAGGAAGQGIGEGIRQWIQNLEGKSKGYDPGAIASETAQGGIYGALPGSQLVKGIKNPIVRTLATGAKNFAGGAIAGGGTQAVRNIQQGNPVGQDVGNQAVETGAINTALPGITRAVPSGIKALLGVALDKIPTSVRKQLDSLSAQMDQLHNEKLGNTVGFANIKRAGTNGGLGITPSHTPQQAQNIIEKEMQDVGGSLNGALGHESVGTNLANIKNEFLRARDQAFSGNGKNDEKLTDFTDRMSSFIKAQVQKAAEENAAAQTPASEAAAKAAVDASARAEQNASSPATTNLGGAENSRTVKFGKQGNPITSIINGVKMEPKPGESPQKFMTRLQNQVVAAPKAAKGTKLLATESPTAPLSTGAQRQAANDFQATPVTGGMNRDQAVDFANDQSPISLLTVNKIKTQLGKLAYGKDGEIKDPIFAQAYHNLQRHIEDSSGNPEQIRGLNAEYDQLRNMSHHAQREIESPKMTNTDFQAKKLALENKTPRNQALDTLSAFAPLLGQMTLGPIGAGLGGSFTLYRALSALMANQGVQKRVADTADRINASGTAKAARAISKPSVANPIQRILQQAAVQSPGGGF